MPYLHWEAKPHYDKMRECVGTVEGRDPPNAPSPAQTKYQGILQQRKDEIHIRRSLDESYYWSLPSTRRRDDDQVVTRYHTKFAARTGIGSPNDPAPLLMVDQLWLWVLNGNQNQSRLSIAGLVVPSLAYTLQAQWCHSSPELGENSTTPTLEKIQ